jgi:hypothetical protein
MTGVAARILQQIVLVFRLGLPEVTRRHDLGHDLAGPVDRRGHCIHTIMVIGGGLVLLTIFDLVAFSAEVRRII